MFSTTSFCHLTHFIVKRERLHVGDAHEYNPTDFRSIISKVRLLCSDFRNRLREPNFYKEEIDEQLVPPFVLEHLEDPIQTESANYTDAKGDYYLVIQVETGEVKPYEIWIINDEIQSNFCQCRMM